MIYSLGQKQNNKNPKSSMDLLQKYNNKKIAEYIRKSSTPSFRAGDTLKVHVRIKDGSAERVQVYEGVCIARHNKSMGSSFTVRRIGVGQEGIERIFPLHSPVLEKIEVVRRGSVRRAKLYYLRDRKGKSARIKELSRYHSRSNPKTETPKDAASAGTISAVVATTE